jgi:hypothetical protein
MIESTLALRQTIDDPGLIDLTGHISHLPATPEIFAELRQCLSGTACDIQRITDLIRRDPALTARFYADCEFGLVHTRGTNSRYRSAITHLGWSR